MTGRWISKDPILLAGGLNLYVFCGNDPVNFSDPSGLCEGASQDFFDITNEPGIGDMSFDYIAFVAGSLVKLPSLGGILDTLLGSRAANTGLKLLGPGTQFGAKIEGQLAKRGWTKDLVRSTIDKPTRTVPWRDTRHLPGGVTMDDAATAYYSRRGGYVVRNNRTGDIIQVSDRTDPAWIAPWE